MQRHRASTAAAAAPWWRDGAAALPFWVYRSCRHCHTRTGTVPTAAAKTSRGQFRTEEATMTATDNLGPGAPGEGIPTLRAKWGWIVAFGAIALIAGVIALGSVVMATASAVMIVGFMMLMVG